MIHAKLRDAAAAREAFAEGCAHLDASDLPPTRRMRALRAEAERVLALAPRGECVAGEVDGDSAPQQVVNRVVDAGVGLDAAHDGLGAIERGQVLGQSRCTEGRERSLLETRRVCEGVRHFGCRRSESPRVLLGEEYRQLQQAGRTNQDDDPLDGALPFEELVPIRLLEIYDQKIGALGVDHIGVHAACTLRAELQGLKPESAGADDNETEELPCAPSATHFWWFPCSSAREA